MDCGVKECAETIDRRSESNFFAGFAGGLFFSIIFCFCFCFAAVVVVKHGRLIENQFTPSL